MSTHRYSFKINSLITIVMIFIMTFFLPNLFAEDLKNVKLLRVYDGDTIFVDISGLPAVFGKDLGIRIRGIDTPELSGADCDKEKQLAVQARDFLIGIMNNASQIDLINVDRDKYFRVLATVLADGVDISVLLLQKQLAKKYDGGKKQSWCSKS